MNSTKDLKKFMRRRGRNRMRQREKTTPKYWWERTTGFWDTFHANNARSYYMFLRAVHAMTATEAWSTSKKYFE